VLIAVNPNGGAAAGGLLELPVGDNPVALWTDDVDGNGHAHIMTANAGSGGTMSVLLNEGGGSFAPSVDLPVGQAPRSIVAFDMEQHGDLDIAVVADSDDPMTAGPIVQIVRNDTGQAGGGPFILAEAEELAAGTGLALVGAGDLDGDRDEDLITIASGAGSVAGGGASGGATASLDWRLNDLYGMPTCREDTNDDGLINVDDLVGIILAWGACPPRSCGADVNGDQVVDVDDLVAVILAWGACKGA
jgi:hypothetical protein